MSQISLNQDDFLLENNLINTIKSNGGGIETTLLLYTDDIVHGGYYDLSDNILNYKFLILSAYDTNLRETVTKIMQVSPFINENNYDSYFQTIIATGWTNSNSNASNASTNSQLWTTYKYMQCTFTTTTRLQLAVGYWHVTASWTVTPWGHLMITGLNF